jgi:mono/diheme cytochrome c family protein
MLRTILLAAAGMFAGAGLAQAADASIDMGRTVSIIGGCHDCHTADYNRMGGKINPDTALAGNTVGFRGPWGTTYPVNLRLLAKTMNEDDWVKHLQTFTTRPPMPFYNVHALDETQMRSLHLYILSLGAPGDPAPAFVPPDQEPKFPYSVLEPPVMPKT